MIGGVSRLASLLGSLAGLSCCAPPPASCLLPTQHSMVIAELFFGRGVAGRAPLTAAEWRDFAARVVTPNFPLGFTVTDGNGQWQDPRTGRISREPSLVLTIAAEPAGDLARRLTAIIDTYKAEFHQQSVGLVTTEACAAF